MSSEGEITRMTTPGGCVSTRPGFFFVGSGIARRKTVELSADPVKSVRSDTMANEPQKVACGTCERMHPGKPCGVGCDCWFSGEKVALHMGPLVWASDPPRPLVDRLADELAWWLNWSLEAESVPRRSFDSARAAGIALIREVDPRRVGE